MAKKRTVRSHVFRGRRLKILYGRLPKGDDGVCFDPNQPGKCIIMRPSLNGKRELETALHESLHACFWDLDCDGAIHPAAADIAKFLWRLGYRIPD